jgi:hypothetical protein
MTQVGAADQGDDARRPDRRPDRLRPAKGSPSQDGRGSRERPSRASSADEAGRGPGGAPPTPREPIGRERAAGGALPPRTRGPSAVAPPRPELPWDDEPVLPTTVRKEIDRAVGGKRAREVALALSVGSAAIDEGLIDVARPALAWARHEAPRSPSIREAYGVALYLDEAYAAALSELQAYRRMTGRVDQNHLIADCLRALDRGLDRVADAVQPLLADDQAPADRRAEAAIVWAAATADADHLATARALLRRWIERMDVAGERREEHVLRVRWFAARLAERDGDTAEAGRYRAEIAAVDPDFLAVVDDLEVDDRDEEHEASADGAAAAERLDGQAD